ncbi:MAG TPA: MFS transporter [Desulfobulbaceae bacterium]|nr:MFS transporter [Desulfobulbaceae bacterium]
MFPPTNFRGLCLSGFLAKASYALARTPVLALFAASFGAGPEAIGFAVAISTVTGIFFKMPAGVVSDIIGRRRTMMIGLLFFAVIPFLYLFVHSYNGLLAVRFLHGFATAIYGPVIMAVVVDTAGNRRGEMLSLFSSITIIGNLIGPPLGGFLLERLAGGGSQELVHFHIIYGVVATLGMAALITGIRAGSSLPGNGNGAAPGRSTVSAVFSHFFHSLRNILTDRRIVATSNMEGMQNLAVGALEAFMPIYVVMVLGYSAFQAGLLWGVQIVVTLFAKPLMGRISDRHGRRPLLFWGMFVCAVPFGAIPWVTDYSLLLLLSMVFGLGEAIVTSSSAAMVADFCREDNIGSAMGVFGTLYDVGHASGPILAGFLISLAGGNDFRPAFAGIAAILICSTLLFRRAVPASR